MREVPCNLSVEAHDPKLLRWSGPKHDAELGLAADPGESSGYGRPDSLAAHCGERPKASPRPWPPSGSRCRSSLTTGPATTSGGFSAQASGIARGSFSSYFFANARAAWRAFSKSAVLPPR